MIDKTHPMPVKSKRLKSCNLNRRAVLAFIIVGSVGCYLFSILDLLFRNFASLLILNGTLNCISKSHNIKFKAGFLTKTTHTML